jgi:hypothetical protein
MRWVLSVLFWARVLVGRVADVRVVCDEKATRWRLADPTTPARTTLAETRWLPDSP